MFVLQESKGRRRINDDGRDNLNDVGEVLDGRAVVQVSSRVSLVVDGLLGTYKLVLFFIVIIVCYYVFFIIGSAVIIIYFFLLFFRYRR